MSRSASQPAVMEPNLAASNPVLKRWAVISLLLVPVGTAGAFFMGWLMPYGAGIYVDSLYYVSSARNLVAGIGMGRVTGLGIFKPMTHYPPFYSLLLGFFDVLGVNELTTARWVSLLAFGLTIVLVGLLIYQRTGSGFFSQFSALLVLVSNPILRNYSWVMTEPLYLVLMLSSILCISIYSQDSNIKWLVLTAVFASLCLLTRYVGFSLVGALFLVIILNRQLTWKLRLRHLIIFLIITILPISAWLIRNWLVSGSLANRVLTWHPISSENASFLVKAINSWGLLPQRLLVGQGTIVFLVVMVLFSLGSLYWLLRSIPQAGKAPKTELTILLAGWFYIALLVFSLFTLDATTRLENRILLPLYVLVMVLIITGLALLWQRKSLIARLATALVCLWLAFFSITRVDGAISDLRADGQGYASQRWQNSPTISFLHRQDASLIYTNDVTAVYFLADKDSVAIPNANSTESDLAQMRQHLTPPGSYLVIFGSLTGEFAPLDRLTQELTLVDVFEDGSVYQLH